MPPPSDQPRLIRQKPKPGKQLNFVNWHQTVKQPLRGRFELHNPESTPSLLGYQATARALQELAASAQQKATRLRALGAAWSFSEVAAVDGWLLDTAYLNWVFRLDRHSLTDVWAARAAGLVLAQCGVTIHELNRYLEHDKHRSLRTSGASNGQTVAGAMSADTHGSAIDQGPFASQAVGLHLITATEQLWIERASDPVVSTTFAARIGVRLIRDDAAFDAAVVGLGSLGVIHAVLIDTVPRFKLVETQRRVAHDATLQHAMDTLDFSALGFEERPYFFQVVLNPHANTPEAYRKEMFLEPCPEDYVPNYALTDGRGAGYDVARLVGRFVDTFPSFTSAIARQLVKAELKEKGPRSGTWGETFDFTTPRAKSAGAALGVPLARCTEALALVREAFEAAGGAPMVFACRYVKHSPALLSIARFAPVTCVIDLDGVYAKSTLAVMEGTRERLERAGIPFTQHWGKLHGLTRERVRASHGAELETWLRVRRQLLPSAADRFTFSNPLLDRLGMSD